MVQATQVGYKLIVRAALTGKHDTLVRRAPAGKGSGH